MRKLALIALLLSAGNASEYGVPGACRINLEFAPGTTGTIPLACHIPANATIWDVAGRLLVAPGSTGALSVGVLSAGDLVAPMRVANHTTVLTQTFKSAAIQRPDPATWVRITRAATPFVSVDRIAAGRLFLFIQYVVDLCQKPVCP